MDTTLLPERVSSKFIVDEVSGCWLWTASRCHGYGYVVYGGKLRRAHRVTYEILVGPIPEGLTIDHLCCVKNCVNPDHLEPVTVRENTMRAPHAPSTINARKTHCARGHAFTTENTYRRPRTGYRECRTCQEISWKKARQVSS